MKESKAFQIEVLGWCKVQIDGTFLSFASLEISFTTFSAWALSRPVVGSSARNIFTIDTLYNLNVNKYKWAENKALTASE